MFYFENDDINNDNDKKRANSLSQTIVLVGDWVTMTQGTQQRFPGASPSCTKRQSKQPLTSLDFQLGTHCHLARVLTKHGDEHLSLLMLYILFSNASICAKVAASLLTRM